MSLLALRAILNQQGASWSPLDLPGIVGWWDASDASSFTYSSGTSVSQWANLAGSNHLVQATSAQQPNRNVTQNGLDAVAFDGGDMMATASAMTIAANCTVILAVKCTAAGLFMEHSVNTDPNEGFYWYATIGNSVEWCRMAGVYGRNDVSSDWAVTSAWDCLTLNNTGSAVTIRRDGSALSLSPVGDQATGTGSTAQVLHIGARAGLIVPITAHYGEIIVCSGDLGTTDRDLAEDYIAAKWAT